MLKNRHQCNHQALAIVNQFVSSSGIQPQENIEATPEAQGGNSTKMQKHPIAPGTIKANSCEEYAIGRLYKTKYDVCNEDNNSECKCTVPLLLLVRVLLHVMYRVSSMVIEKLLFTLK